MKVNGYFLMGSVVAGAVLLGLWVKFDPPLRVGVVKARVTKVSVASTHWGGARASYKAVWAVVENGATAGFSADYHQSLFVGQCVEFIHTRRKYVPINSYVFHRFC